MNPLSAIRQYIAQVPAGLGQMGGAEAKIPTGELNGLSAPGLADVTEAAKPVEGSFSGVLGHFVNEVNAKQSMAVQTVQDLQSGQNVSLHQAMIAMEEASVSFQLMVEVRNRLLESYQELMRMQV